MSNLIITLISIALVAVLSIAGIYYGGAAFEAAQARAYANTIAQQAVQINNAITQWQADNGGAGFLTAVQQQIASCGGSTGWSTIKCSGAGQNPIANVLTSNWLQSMAPPDTNDFAGSDLNYSAHSRWDVSGSDFNNVLQAGSGATYGYFTWLYGVQPITSTAVQVCNQIAIMARGPNAVPVHPSLSNPPHVYVTGENPVLDCYWGSNTIASLNACIGTGSQGTSNGQTCMIFIAAQINAAF